MKDSCSDGSRRTTGSSWATATPTSAGGGVRAWRRLPARPVRPPRPRRSGEESFRNYHMPSGRLLPAVNGRGRLELGGRVVYGTILRRTTTDPAWRHRWTTASASTSIHRHPGPLLALSGHALGGRRPARPLLKTSGRATTAVSFNREQTFDGSDGARARTSSRISTPKGSPRLTTGTNRPTRGQADYSCPVAEVSATGILIATDSRRSTWLLQQYFPIWDKKRVFARRAMVRDDGPDRDIKSPSTFSRRRRRQLPAHLERLSLPRQAR